MRRANNTGTIFKLKGNRHNPYVAYVYGEKVVNEEKKTTYRKRTAIGYYHTQREAQDALTLYLQAPFDLKNSNITFGEIWEIIYKKLDLSASRIQAYKTAYTKYLQPIKEIPIRDIKAIQLQDIIDNCTAGSSTKTNIKAVMTKVYDYAMQNDLVNKDYTDYIKFKKDRVKVERHLFTHEEIEVVWKRAEEWQYAFLLILLYTGLRPKELADLKQENVNLEERYIRVVESKTEAGIRLVPIHDDIFNLISNLMQNNSVYVFLTARGNKVERKNYTSRDMPKICEYLNTEHTPYDCRHTFTTRAREAGVDHLCIQRIIGHKPSSVTEQVYTHLQMQELLSEINKIKL